MTHDQKCLFLYHLSILLEIVGHSTKSSNCKIQNITLIDPDTCGYDFRMDRLMKQSYDNCKAGVCIYLPQKLMVMKG